MPRSPASKRVLAPYRIKDLCEMTGVSREAIRFYINEGLMPPPEKSAHNMGWYGERHVELLRLIQKLQSERFMPLKAIRSVLQGRSDLSFTPAQTEAFEEMRRKLATDHRDLVVSDDPDLLAKEVGLSRGEQKELKALGVAASGMVTISDVEIARQWVAIRDAGLSPARGFSPTVLSYMRDVVDIAFRNEIALFADRMRSLDRSEAAKVVDVVIPALNRLFALMHERRVAEFLREQFGSKLSPRPAAAKEGNKARRARRG